MLTPFIVVIEHNGIAIYIWPIWPKAWAWAHKIPLHIPYTVLTVKKDKLLPVNPKVKFVVEGKVVPTIFLNILAISLLLLHSLVWQLYIEP